MFCLSAASYYARRALHLPIPHVKEVASKIIEISPPIKRKNRPALILPGQLERVVSVPEMTDLNFELYRLSDSVVEHCGSYAYLLKDAVLNNGMLYCKSFASHRLIRPIHKVFMTLEHEMEPCALYSSLYGSTYWGHWLKDDCSTYLEASKIAKPVTPLREQFSQQLAYEKLLGMKDEKKSATFFEELWVFEDFAQNESRRIRYKQLRAKLLQSVGLDNPVKHPGVYVSRGQTGTLRLLLNEEEVIQYLKSRGFTIIDTLNFTAEEIVHACAGARVVCGVEGSSLSHGAMLLEEEDSILVLNPPNRFNNIYKDVSDCKSLNYATVVGKLEGCDFRIDIGELEKTLSLLPD